MKYSTYILFVLSILTISCSNSQYMVKGISFQSIMNNDYAYMLPMDYPMRSATIDSCRVIHGRFEMSGNLDSIQCVVISMGSIDIPAVLEEGVVTVSYHNSSIEVSGTPMNDEFYDFLRSRDSLLMVNKVHYYNDISYKDYTRHNLSGNSVQAQVHLEEMIRDMDCNFIRSNFDNVLGISWFLRICYEASAQCGFYTIPEPLMNLYNSAPSDFKNNKEIRAFRQMSIDRQPYNLSF